MNYNVTVFGDESEFGIRYTFPEKAVTGKVCSGAWAIYSEPDFKGKVLYQVGSKDNKVQQSSINMSSVIVTQKLSLKHIQNTIQFRIKWFKFSISL